MKFWIKQAIIALAVYLWAVTAWAAPAPKLRSYNPSPIASSSAQTITVTGQWLRAGLSPSIGTASSVTNTSFRWTVTLATPGGVTLTVRNPDGKVSNELTVQVAGVTNQAPRVNAGADQTVILPTGSASVGVSLVGTVSDDGLPVGGALTQVWSRPSGPAAVTFSASTSTSTTATFTTAGTYVLRLTATDTLLTTTDDLTVIVQAEVVIVPPGTGPTYGPTADIVCPTGAVSIASGSTASSRQTAIDANPTGTAFCLAAGVHTATAATTPKSGDSFTGEFGAIIDGTGWTSSDSTQGAFRAHNQEIDNVTIRNLEIRNMPQKGIHAFYDFSDGWTIDHCNIHHNKDGISLSNGGTVSNNYLHDNIGILNDPDAGLRGGNYVFSYRYNTGAGMQIVNNEISFGGQEQKSIDAHGGLVWRGNYVHDNTFAGIWVDGDAVGSLIENNVVEDNAGPGIMWEQARQGIIRYNTIRRSGDQAIFISTSNMTDVYSNTLEDNYRGVVLFINCAAVGSQPWNPDLHDVHVYDNTIRVPTTGGALANTLGYTSCTANQLSAYTSGAKVLSFTHNTYTVPTVTSAYWLWAAGTLSFSQWQVIPQDTTGSVSPRP